MSPRASPPIQVPYWLTSGLSTPSWWSRAATALGAASGPRMARPGSPGSTWPPKNTITLSSHSVISARPRRFRKYVATWPPLAGPIPSVPVTLSVQAYAGLDHSSVIRRKGGVPVLIGESFVGEGVDAAHVNTVLGDRDGPV